MHNNKWTKNELMALYQYRNIDNKEFPEIANLLKKSIGSIKRKYVRVEWVDFIKDPDNYLLENDQNKKWNQVEMTQLDAYLQTKKMSYAEIANKLNRSIISVERKAQSTDWQAWRVANEDTKDIDSENKEIIIAKLVKSLLLLSRYEYERLRIMSQEEFCRKINIESTQLPIPFSELQNRAGETMDSLGFGNPETLQLGEGSYIVVGDSHGKMSKKNMFKLLLQLDLFLKPKNIIHLGHILDDDNDISYDWGKIKNLVVVAKSEELRLIQEQRHKFNFNFEIVRGGVSLGSELIVTNQDIISDYVKTPLTNLDAEIFDRKVVVNSHRLELTTKCSNEESSYFVSPGSLCEKFVAKTIKQIDFEDNKTVKQAFADGFSKYRKMQHMCKYWTQGLLVVHVDLKGEHTIVPCLIRKIGKEYITSYFDKMITSTGIDKPNEKIFITADLHSPNFDHNVLRVQEAICSDYKPDILVNVGDAHDYRSLNHHDMDKGRVVTGNVLDEAAKTHLALRKMRSWAKFAHLIHGNHERFAQDFISKFPQFGEYLDINFLCGLEDLGYKLTDLKNVLKIGTTKFIHGDIKMYGQPGSKMEKVSRTFGENVFIGHIHSPGIRFGCYSIGLSGLLDQDYNEPTASNWVHGFGLCNHYKGKSWPTTIAIIDNQCILNKKTYKFNENSSWISKKYKARLVYDIENHNGVTKK